MYAYSFLLRNVIFWASLSATQNLQTSCIYIDVCFFTRIITGFGDKEGTREFLFALPRFAADEVNIYIVK